VFVPGFADRASGDDYCLSFDLIDRTRCYVSQIPPPSEPLADS
jgi:hypothetical protein